MLNRGNRPAVAAAVDATGVVPGGTAADIGFGGGVGLAILLKRVGRDGVVHGVEIADDMLARARSRFAGDVETGRLRLARGSLTALPLDDASLDAAITVNTVYFVLLRGRTRRRVRRTGAGDARGRARRCRHRRSRTTCSSLRVDIRISAITCGSGTMGGCLPSDHALLDGHTHARQNRIRAPGSASLNCSVIPTGDVSPWL
jgi:Methyltransferase domain